MGESRAVWGDGMSGLRQDLALAQWAKEAGFKVLSPSNQQRGRYFLYDPELPAPSGDLSFELKDCHVWSTRDGWRYADLVSGHYCNHSRFFSDLRECLSEVIERETVSEC